MLPCGFTGSSARGCWRASTKQCSQRSCRNSATGVERQRPIAIDFEGLHFDAAFKADLIVGGSLLVEIKSVERLSVAHAKQLLTYLRLTKQPLGLLINFGGETLKEGLRRIVNGHTSFASSRLRVNQPSSFGDQ